MTDPIADAIRQARAETTALEHVAALRAALLGSGLACAFDVLRGERGLTVGIEVETRPEADEDDALLDALMGALDAEPAQPEESAERTATTFVSGVGWVDLEPAPQTLQQAPQEALEVPEEGETSPEAPAPATEPPSAPQEAPEPAPAARAFPRGGGWTEEEEERLLSLKARGLSDAVVAAQLGRSPGAVSGRLFKLRAKGRAPEAGRPFGHEGPDETAALARLRSLPDDWTDDDMRVLVSMLNDGLPIQAVADEVAREPGECRTRYVALGAKAGSPAYRAALLRVLQARCKADAAA